MAGRRVPAPAWAALIAVAACLAVPVAGCGGGQAAPDSAASSNSEPATPNSAEDSGEVQIPPEKFDQIQTFFDRKRRIMSRCFVDAIEAEELPSQAEGYVTLSMTIGTGGDLGALKVAEATLDSQLLHRCMLERAASWTVTTLPTTLDYTYTFSFNTL